MGTFAGADFRAGAVRHGTAAITDLVGAVDFPSFVGGLIQSVFQAIVAASIRQMHAYAEMLKSVAQTMDQFAQDNTRLNNARDWLVDKYPADPQQETGLVGLGAGRTPRCTARSKA